MTTACPCRAGKPFDECCGPLLEGAARPPTAERLMRSRFTAYAVGAVEYLIRTTHPSTRDRYRPAELREWSAANRWDDLEIVATARGTAADREGTVEFRAFYRDAAGAAHIHHEISTFRKELGRWFFVSGEAGETPST